jgi:hypothetical protein
MTHKLDEDLKKYITNEANLKEQEEEELLLQHEIAEMEKQEAEIIAELARQE